MEFDYLGEGTLRVRKTRKEPRADIPLNPIKEPPSAFHCTNCGKPIIGIPDLFCPECRPPKRQTDPEREETEKGD